MSKHVETSAHQHGSTEVSKDPATTGQFEYDTAKIGDIVLQKGLKSGWLFGFTIAFILLQVMFISIAWLLVKGTGIWGLNMPVAWGFAIINFVWWVGIGHAGTLISAVLLLFRQTWRTSINRFAEAMTLFAVACAGMFPLFHVGRPWFAYWLFPYPNTMGVWPQFRSPLLWDVFAISTYASVSLLFWYVGLIPDLASLRDRAKNRFSQVAYGILSLGWIGSARHWKRYTDIYLLLAGLATPLVLSVHTIVSFDFAVSQVPGWHATIFPPYFVAGAIFSGFAMVLTLVIPLRVAYDMKEYFTDWHLDCMAKVMLASGLVVAYGYVLEHFVAWYSDHSAEVFMLLNRMGGPYAWSYWSLMLCNIAIPQLLWIPVVRRNVYWLFFISIVINIGMWLERFVIVVTSLHRDFIPGSWGMYYPTFWDWSFYIGTFGLFFSLLFIFLRVLPMVTIFEIRESVHHEALHGSHHEGDE
ncbi:NrfD/PsrC family molybdoenzyme membrane anchor subunit [Planctomicrobium sp. SH527]|uniref:NrfD/PsrC family molybdoenzyme membrane anchor subunit n=1 Tax=Planctomicrobium sp. SH527 TaxID=3448123 RepID=UPI003F5AE0B6